ncbi:MAG: hypothetical protein ABIF17_02275 [Patescibacteria group bacterium]
MKRRLNTIKYKIKGQIFDLFFGLEGKKMKASIMQSLIKELQERVKRFNPDAPWKIKPYVAEYLEDCLVKGRPVNILVQWCVTKILDERKKMQDGLKALPDEIKFFNEDLPRLIGLLKKWGLKVDVIITFNLSEFEKSRPSQETIEEYIDLVKSLTELPEICFMNGKEFFGFDVISPNQKILSFPEQFIKPNTLNFEVERGKKIMLDYGYQISEDRIRKDTISKIAGMAEEGRILCEDIFPEGFLLVPIENPERYDFFSLLIKSFKDRLVPVVRRYPWRYKELY